METMFDFTYFYAAFGVCLLIGFISAIYRKPIGIILQDVEQKASERTL